MRHLQLVEPRFRIRNHGRTAIRDVTAGARRGGEDHGLASFAVIHARDNETVKGAELRTPWLADVHDRAAQDAFVYWVRFFGLERHEWEAVYEPNEHRVVFTQLHEPLVKWA